jgi:sugar phosphate isomerase/epimerase
MNTRSATRRRFLAASAGVIPVVAMLERESMGIADDRQPLGVVIHSFSQRLAASRAGAGSGRDRFDDAASFLEFAHAAGARGVQVGIGPRDEAACDALRERAQTLGMFLEGDIRLPRDRDDLGRFEAEVRSSARAGATVIRTVMLSGRRYETFTTLAAFRRAADAATRSLALAEPVAARAGIRLAVENHKDWRADELVAILKRVDSAHVGACLDTGNSIALLEDPMEVIEALAPWSFTTHLKDMGVEEYEQGFLLSEVPLGDGFLNLKRMVRLVREAKPEARLILEMITRDPLRVPCLTEPYWATFPDLPGRQLARALAMVRSHAAKRPLRRLSGLSEAQRFQLEDENVHRCLTYAQAHFGT